MDNRDIGFRQYITDVESNRRYLANVYTAPTRAWAEETAGYLTIYRYAARDGDDLFSIAARCNIPYSALASLNRITGPGAFAQGRILLLPSCPGLFIPENLSSDFERITVAARQDNNAYAELTINNEIFYFFPGADYTPTERAYFLNAGFRFPLQNYRITSSFGMRVSPISGSLSMHQGIDLAAPEGTEVFAVADGTVTAAGEDPVYGIYIIITHRDGWTSLYGHLQRTEITLNSTVRSGTLIGRVGTTGQSTGPHLHFELRQGGIAVDPSGRLRP